MRKYRKIIKTPTIVLCAGGTGGHVFPAISLGLFLKDQAYRVLFVTDWRGQNIIIKKEFGPSFRTMVLFLFRNTASIFMPIFYPFTLLCSFVQSIIYLLWHRPQMVIGFGGYPSVPTVAAAQLLGIPTMVHEQNALLGRANRVLGKKAQVIALSFPHTLCPDAYRSKILVSGNPVLPEVLGYAHQPFTLPKEIGEPFVIVVTGGSQGAKIVSDLVSNAICSIKKGIDKGFIVYHQCPDSCQRQVQELYKNHHVDATVASFFINLPLLMAKAHLVIGRAGATTIAELIVLQRPAILIPLKASLEGDQAKNAALLAKNKCALVFYEDELHNDSLAIALNRLIKDPSLLMDMHEAYQNFEPLASVSLLMQAIYNHSK